MEKFKLYGEGKIENVEETFHINLKDKDIEYIEIKFKKKKYDNEKVKEQMDQHDKRLTNLFERHSIKLSWTKCDLCGKRIFNDYVVEMEDNSWLCKECFIEKGVGI